MLSEFISVVTAELQSRTAVRSIRFSRVGSALRCLMLFGALALASGCESVSQANPKLIIDSDSANEIDDPYAIVRLLAQDQFDVIALNATQWRHYLGEQDSVRASLEVNDKLRALTGRTDVVSLRGSDDPVGKPWGGTEPKDSEAAQFLIAQMAELPAEEKLTVVCLGAATNVASALKMAPEIAPRLRVYWLACLYDAEKRVWNKSEFNVRRDLNAADVLFNFEELELHVMPATTAWAMKVQRDETFAFNDSLGDLGHYLTERWKSHDSDSSEWILWDVALVEAILDPESAQAELRPTPPENTPREVFVYTQIEPERMWNAYQNAVRETFAK